MEGDYMKIYHEFTVSKNLIDLFRNHEYERYVLYMMEKSQKVFPGEYEMVKEQSHGECDFIEVNSNAQYDVSAQAVCPKCASIKCPFRLN